MDFGEALKCLRANKLVHRTGWNGKNMFLVLVSADEWSTTIGAGVYELGKRLPWIGIGTADGRFVPWLASQTDILADDWETTSK